MTRADVRLLAFLLFAALVAIPATSLGAGVSGEGATICGPAGVTHVDLATDGRYIIEGREGDVVFAVRDGVLSCTSSSCDAQVCVRVHTVSTGRPVVCAPNGVSAMLTSASQGAAGGELDAVSR